MAEPELTEKAHEAVPAVPPSTAEVSVRTLQSDLELIGRSGGMPVSQFTRIEVPADTSPAPGPAGVPLPQAPPPQVRESGFTRAVIWILVIAIGAGILFLAGYYIAPLFGK